MFGFTEIGPCSVKGVSSVQMGRALAKIEKNHEQVKRKNCSNVKQYYLPLFHWFELHRRAEEEDDDDKFFR